MTTNKVDGNLFEKVSIDEQPSPVEYKGTVYILSGLPGAAKSFTANVILDACTWREQSCEVCCADDFFMVNGVYKWRADGIAQAHAECRAKFKNALDNHTDVVIVANTNTTTKETEYYETEANKAGYFVQKLLVGELTNEAVDVYAKRNLHGVSKEIILKMRDRILKTLNVI
jgi:hypothetical protein